jgi:hypothetical protein
MGFIGLLYAGSSASTSIFGNGGGGGVDRYAKCYTLHCKSKNKQKGAQSMEAGNEAAAAILVQTIFLKDGHLQGLLGEQATKSPLAAAEFLKPFYRAALAMVSKTKGEDKS